MHITVPSARNFEIFHRLVQDGASLRQVADEFELSHNRVAEIQQQVQRWRKYVAPDWDQGRNRRQDSVVLCRFHQDRSAHLYGVMMNAWRSSGERQTQRGGTIITTTSPGDIKYISQALRCSREQMNTSLVIAKLPDNYFEPIDDVEVVSMTPAEVAQESREEASREEMEAARREYAERKMRETERIAELLRTDEDEELDEDDFAPEDDSDDQPPVSVLTAPRSVDATSLAKTSGPQCATADDETTSDVADILRQQARHDRRKKISPVQPTPANEEKRRELAAKLFGT